MTPSSLSITTSTESKNNIKPHKPWRHQRLLMFTTLLIMAVYGCGDDDPTQRSTTPDAGEAVDAGADSGPDGTDDGGVNEPDDVDTADVDEDVVLPETLEGTPRSEDPPVAASSPPEPLVVSSWMVAYVSNPANSDPVGDALDEGTFVVPTDAGDDDNGTMWYDTEPAENGALPGSPFGYVYGAATVEIPAGKRLIARADAISTVFAAGRRQPGDVYASGRLRVPLASAPGPVDVIVQGFGGRGAPKILLELTSDELHYNLNDLITPDPIEGESTIQYMGAQVLNTGTTAIKDVVARVLPNAYFEETALLYPSLGGGGSTQLAFRLRPSGPMPAAGTEMTVTLRLASPNMAASYERDVTLTSIAPGEPFKRTFRSRHDNSAQYYGVRPPSEPDPSQPSALVLSLHGASVQAIGQARSYSARDWAYVVAPTNRRPFGFDWEVWGRLDGIEVLDLATEDFNIDPTRVYLTGHSMGGHGSWQLGALYPGRFATVGPSAGWSSFYSYTGRSRPGGPFARSQASSDTGNYLSNLARRGVYIIHGSADDNVPVREGRDMYAATAAISDDVFYHEQPGAGHWWNGDVSPGVDCVDWSPLFDFMQARRLDPMELEFDFTTPGPWVSDTHAFVEILSQETPWEDSNISSALTDGEITLNTTNVRGMILDGAALLERGVETLSVDETEMSVIDGPMEVGTQTGKRPGVHGPFNEIWYRPFCYVYAENGPEAYKAYAGFLLSLWSHIGNGHGCAMPASELSDSVRENHNIIYLGLPDAAVNDQEVFSWSPEGIITAGETSFEDAALAFVFPEGDRLSGVMVTAPGFEHLLYTIRPFTSSFVLPDYFIWSDEGGLAGGFFTPDWQAISPSP